MNNKELKHVEMTFIYYLKRNEKLNRALNKSICKTYYERDNVGQARDDQDEKLNDFLHLISCNNKNDSKFCFINNFKTFI